MQLLVDQVELVRVVGVDDLALQPRAAIHHPAIERQQLCTRESMHCRVETRQVREQETRRVADASIRVGSAPEDLVGDGHLGTVVGGSDPQTQDVRAECLHHLLWRDHVATRFRHLASIGVHGEPVREHRPVRRATVNACGCEQRGLEPATVLVGAFEVQIGGEGQPRAPRQHAGVRDAGVEPHVQGIVDPFVLRCIITQQLHGIDCEPGIDTTFFDAQRRLLDQLRRARMELTALAVHEQSDRHAPGALARNAPVGAILQHALDARPPPGRHELHVADRLARSGQQQVGLHGDEPLGRCAKDHRRLVAPAVRVAVLVRHLVQQRATLAQQLDDRRVGLEHVLAGHERRALDEHALPVDRVQHIEAIRLPDQKVIRAMPGSSVHRAGTRLGRDVLPENHRNLAFEKRMLQRQALERRATTLAEELEALDAEACQGLVCQRLGKHQVLGVTPLIGAHQHIRQLRVQRNGKVRRQCPGRGRPDRDRNPRITTQLDAKRTPEGRRIEHTKAHVHRRRGPLLVLDLGLCKRRAAVHAPVHRLHALQQMAIGNDAPERAHDIGLEGKIHGEIGILPVTEHTEANEILALALHLAEGIVATVRAKLVMADSHARLADLLLDIELDRQSVTVPTRHIGSIVAVQCACLDDDVLQDLVHRVPDMDLAVGVRRTVVQDEFRSPGPCRPNLSIDILGLPARQHLGLARGQVRLHGKSGLGKVQRVLVIAHGLHCFPLRAGSGKIRPRHADVFHDVPAQFVQRIEPALFAHLMTKDHLDRSPVEVAGKVEQMSLEVCPGAIAHRRSGTDIGHTGPHTIPDAHLDHIHPRERRAGTSQFQVRGGHADLASDLAPVDHLAKHAVRATQHALGGKEVPRPEQRAQARTADALALHRNGAGRIHIETRTLALAAQQIDAALTVMPEAQIITDHHIARTKPAHQHRVDERLCGEPAEAGIETDPQQTVHAKPGKHAKLLAKAHQARRGLLRCEILTRQRLEDDHGRGQPALTRARQQVDNHRLVPAVHAIEGTDGHHAAAMAVAQIVQPPDQFQYAAPAPHTGSSRRV